MFPLTKRVSFLRPSATARKIISSRFRRRMLWGFFSFLLVVLEHVVLGISMSVFGKKQSLGFILVQLSDFEERDHLFSSCEVQVEVHSLHGRVLLTNRNQGPKISILSQKCELSQNKQEKAQLPNSTSEKTWEVETAPALAGRNGSGLASCP